MDYAPLLIVSFLVLSVLVIAVVVLLYLNAVKSSKEALLAQSELHSKLQQENSQRWETVQASMQGRSEALMQSALTVVVQELEKQQTTTARTLQETHSQAMSGNASVTMQVTKILGETLTLLGTKDPVAYQMVVGANSISDEANPSPYTSADEAAYLADVAKLEEAQQLLETLTGGAAYAAGNPQPAFGEGDGAASPFQF